MASPDMLVDEAASNAGLRHASMEERVGRASLFAAAVCIAGVLVFLFGQLGWWAVLAGPIYLAGAALATMLAQGRAQALLAVAMATGSIGILVGLAKLAGLA